MDQNTSVNKFLGVGWSFPPTFSKAAGTVTTSVGTEEIEQSLEILLTTSLGERVMLPEYGSNMEDLLFEPVDTSLQTLMIDRIQTAILFYEPRIEIDKIELQTDQILEGVILLILDYKIRASNSRFNFVFPFYRNEGSEAISIR